MDWDQLVSLARLHERDDVFKKIDHEVLDRPELARAGNRCKAILDQLYACTAEDGLTDQMAEVFVKVS